ncbi:MAG TPA: RNA polymerase sigma factor [Gemmatimonadaceae bacterium]|nr:RNA polymerase sigma factor [Gemmatimonadaceae bacterium]
MSRRDVTVARLSGYNEAVIPDATLVRAVLAGDAAAFTTLVDRHARVCLRYATRMLGNVEDAEDATQEAFIRAHGALARYDGSVAFRTWLMTILINRCRTAIGVRRKREDRITPDAEAVARAAVPGDAEDMVLRDAIERALARLDVAHREAFLLKHVEQLSYEEMAQMTNVGVSALKMRVQRACERLQLLLAEDRIDA